MSALDNPWWNRRGEELRFIARDNRTVSGTFLGIVSMDYPNLINAYAVVTYKQSMQYVTEYINLNHIISVQEHTYDEPR